jgi:hypothetical protein
MWFAAAARLQGTLTGITTSYSRRNRNDEGVKNRHPHSERFAALTQ